MLGRTAGIGPRDAAILRIREARPDPELSVLFGISLLCTSDKKFMVGIPKVDCT